MHLLIFVVLSLLAIFSTSNAQVINGTFRTPLDHFRPQNAEELTLNFEANFQHYQSGGPFYIFIKSARETSFQWIERGLMVDIAEETRGALFTFTRRFYGVHRPTQNASFENLELHTLEQSLGDIATFIQYLRQEMQQYDSKVILWGSNNGATMATWARKKFPHLVDGVWSSSGVFYTDLYTSSPHDYLESIISSVGSSECRDLLRDAFSFMENMIENGEGEFLQEKFNLCHPVDTDSVLDIPVFYETQIRNVFAQIQAENTNGVLNFCRDMEAIPGDPFESYVRWTNITFGSDQCTNQTFAGQIEVYSNIEWNSEATDTGMRQWFYTHCTQLSLWIVANESSWIPLDIPFTYHVEKCRQIFGEKYSQTQFHRVPHFVSVISFNCYNADLVPIANANLIREYGSIHPVVSNLIFTNGAIDPYAQTGILATQNPNTVVLIIEGHARSADLTSINLEIDTPILVEAKERIRNQIIEWSRVRGTIAK